MDAALSAPAQTPEPDCRPAPSTGLGDNNLCTCRMTDSTVTDETDLADVVALLDDEHVRSILVLTSEKPLSANELADRCDVSDSSIYRRVDRLVEADLLTEQTRPRSDGHHETVYVSALGRFELVVRDGEMDWTVERAEGDVADELTRMWGKF